MPTRRHVLAASAALAIAPALKAKSSPADIVLGGKPRLRGASAIGAAELVMSEGSEPGVTILTIKDAAAAMLSADAEIGVRFAAAPTLETGVQIWRYAPWKAWTRPLAMNAPADLCADDVQLLYWRERDGSFVVMVPLSGEGFRTTLGQVDGKLSARAVAGAPARTPASLPVLAIGHGADPHAVIAATYRAALAAMGRSEAAATNKQLPEPLRYLGWNSWNASNLGNALDERLLFDAARELRDAGITIGWMMFDDGYFDHREQRLRSFAPNPVKFPQGFAGTIARLKKDYGVRHVGAWLALDGYWHGIDPASPLGREYAADLFTWTERTDVTNPASPIRTNSFIRPDRPSMKRYYDAHFGALKAGGFDFVKVDNQLVVERMAKGNVPIWTLATAMHQGAKAAIRRHFDDAVINCMNLTADAYFNIGTTPVSRAVEDYFPYMPDENYDLEKGNAAAHVLQALYNTLYIGQLAIPDFDMFETTNPNAKLHAVARAANNGPIYVTDLPGKHDIALLQSMTLADGRLLIADAPLMPCRESLFQLQEAKPFKAFSRVGDVPLLAVFNLADADRVSGEIHRSDVPGQAAGAAVAYEHVSGKLARLGAEGGTPVTLERFGAQLWSFHEADDGFAMFGRSDKINGLAAVAAVRADGRRRSIGLHEAGPVAAYCAKRPDAVLLNGRDTPFDWHDGLLRVASPGTSEPGMLIVELA